MTNEQNLIPLNKRTKNDQRKIAKKGGKKSGESRRNKKTLRELLEIALSLKDEFSGEELKFELVKSLIEQAIKGNIKAFEVIRDTIGEKPTDKQNVTYTQPQIVVRTEEDKMVLENLSKIDL